MKFLILLFVTSSALASGFDWQGHRGARGLMPENTIEGMREGLRYPITTLELDVVVSKDNKIVVSHEPWMNPTICVQPEKKIYSEKDFNLHKMDYAEILRFDCGSIKHPRFPDQKKISVGKPLLQALLLEIEAQLRKEKRTVLYNIEIKSDSWQEENGFQPKVPEFSELVVKTIKEVLPLNRVVLQSFDSRVLIYLHEKHPKIVLSWLTEENQTPEQVKEKLGFYPAIFSPDYKKLKYEDVPLYHALEMRVIPWTVNAKEDMKMLMNMGVDGIITDYPNLIQELNQKTCPKGHNLFEDKCVALPAYSLPSDKNPGWVCKDGYMQKRLRCVRIKVPSHATLLPDGKTWECKEKYEKYRGRCRKK